MIYFKRKEYFIETNLTPKAKPGLITTDLSGIRTIFKRIKISNNVIVLNVDKDLLHELLTNLEKETK